MNGWDDTRRESQKAAIHRWRPWVHSTGPKTVDGKAKSKMNAMKHGQRSQAVIQEARTWRKLIREFAGC